MNRKLPSLAFMMALTVAVFVPAVKGASIQTLGPGKMTYVIATIAGGPQTLDPALAYDSASGEIISNVYDPLVFFKTTGSEVVPWLADSYNVSPDGQTYTFHIRTGVQWQDPAYGTVTPADVEYSFERVMVRDFTGGPAWMFHFPIFGTFAAQLTVAYGQAMRDAITRNDVAGTVTIQFQTGMAYLPFLQILSQTWGSVISKQWAIDNGDWNPATQSLDDGGWIAAHDPATSPFDVPAYIMMGSGPFEFNYLNAAVAWSMLRNGGQAGDPHPTTSFWGGWGTTRTNLLGFTGVTSRGYVDEIVEYFISEFATRLAGFLGPAPVYDNIAVPRSQIATVWQQPGIRCQYPLPTQSVDAMFFAYNVSMLSPYIGSPTDDTYFGELGIRPDFFSDVHARKAVAYSFNWPSFIGNAYLGEAQQVGIPLPPAGYEPYYNGSLALMYSRNTTAAINEWQQAWGGQVWTNGFRFSTVYNEGNKPRQTAAEMIKEALELQNPKFHVDVVTVPWNAYGQVWHGGPDGRATGPIYIVGWSADYPDPDDWTVPFMSPSGGTFAYPQHLDMDPNAAMFDNLIAWSAHNATVAGRNANYQQLWKLYHEQCVSLPLENAFDRLWARDWVHGWYYNPFYPGTYAYSMWKEELPWEDINEDGKVDVPDMAAVARALGSYFIQPLLPPNPSAPGVMVVSVASSKTVVGQGLSASINITVRNIGTAVSYTSNWNSRADVNVVEPITGARADMKVDDVDAATVANLLGYVAPPWVPSPSIHDAVVTDVMSSTTVVGQGFSVSTSVPASDQSVLAETFNVSAYADLNVPPVGDEILIGTQTVANVAVGETRTVILTWNTTGVAKGNYTISAVADTSGSSLSDGVVTVAMVGDISGPAQGVPDGKCDIRDLAAIAQHYGHSVPDGHSPGTPAYTACFNSDITGPTAGLPDGKVDIRDLVTAAKNYGKIDP